MVKPGDIVKFIPSHTPSLPCEGKVFSIELHKKSVSLASAGDNCGFNIRGLRRENMPRTGDIMVLKSDNSLKKVSSFTTQVCSH